VRDSRLLLSTACPMRRDSRFGNEQTWPVETGPFRFRRIPTGGAGRLYRSGPSPRLTADSGNARRRPPQGAQSCFEPRRFATYLGPHLNLLLRPTGFALQSPKFPLRVNASKWQRLRATTNFLSMSVHVTIFTVAGISLLVRVSFGDTVLVSTCLLGNG
jgi:hypothetical protein